LTLEPELELVSELAARPCSAIAVLPYQGVAAKDADAITLAILMAVRRATEGSGNDGAFVVAELIDDKHVDLATFAGPTSRWRERDCWGTRSP
jgi:hypothetical protein